MNTVVPFKAEQPAEQFSYAGLDRETEIAAREDAALIKHRMRRTAEDIIEIGRALVRQKNRLPHGSFLPWINAEFGMSDRTARNFMHVAERCGGKSETVSDLSAKALYALASPSTPEAVREEVMSLLVSGEQVTAKDIERMRQEAEQKAKDAERAKARAEQDAEAVRQKAKQLEDENARLKATATDTARSVLEERYGKQIEKLKRDLENQKEKTVQALDDAMKELDDRVAAEKQLKALQEKAGQFEDENARLKATATETARTVLEERYGKQIAELQKQIDEQEKGGADTIERMVEILKEKAALEQEIETLKNGGEKPPRQKQSPEAVVFMRLLESLEAAKQAEVVALIRKTYG